VTLKRARNKLGVMLLVLMAGIVMGPAALASQASSGFGEIRVLGNNYITVPENSLLRHNVPHLSVTVGGETLTADVKGFFDSTGGLRRWGFPTSEVHVEESGTLTQYFQRGVVDFHRRADLGNAYVLERRLAWDFFGGGAGGSPDLGVEPGITNNNSGQLLGPWGHKVSNFSVGGYPAKFLDFFNGLGGVEAFGYPKTEARLDTNTSGRVYIAAATPGFVRQYFQSAVMEYHPLDTSEPVKLRLLGDDLRNQKYPGSSWQQVAAFNAASVLVTGSVFVPEVVPASTATAAVLTPSASASSLPSGSAELVVVGTSAGGLTLYDGSKWTSFGPTNSGLSTNVVRAVVVDKDGLIWAGTDSGVFSVTRAGAVTGYSKASTSNGIGSNDVRALSGRQAGSMLWVGHADQGASRFDSAAVTSDAGSGWDRFRPDNSSLPSSMIRDLHMVTESPESLWLTTANGVARYDRATGAWTLHNTMNSGLVSNDVTAVAIDATGAFWFGTSTAGVSYTKSRAVWTTYTTVEGLGSNSIRDILVASDGVVWIATEGGVTRYINGVFSTSTVANVGLPSDSTRALAEDAQGNIWVATDEGAARFDGAVWKSFTTADGMASNLTTSLAIAPATS
jgi:sugar lactone lactonase YvrE